MYKKTKLIGFVCNDHKKQLLKQLDSLEKFEIIFFCLKHSDKLDLISEGIPESKIVDYPSLYSNYTEECSLRSIENIITDLKSNEQKYNIRSVNKLISYNYGRSVSPKKDIESIYRLIWIEEKMLLDLVNEINPGAMLGELSRSYFLIAYDICTNKGIKYFHPIEYRSSYYGKSLYTLYDDNGTKIGFKEKFESYISSKDKPSEEANIFAENFIENIFNPQKFQNKKLAHFSEDFKTTLKKIKYRVKRISSKTKSYKIDKRFNPEKGEYQNIFYAFLSRVLLRRIVFKYKYFRAKQYFRAFSQNEKFEYIYFPMHFYPEMVSSVWANNLIHYHDQELHLIHLISKNLPSGCKLLVKEHLPMVRNRDITFYKKVDELSNVVLVSPFSDNFELIRNAKAICTIANTTGFEGFLLKKPVFSFHGSFYKFLPGIQHISTTEDLVHFLSSIDEFKAPLDSQIQDVLCAFYDSSKPFEQKLENEDSLDIVYTSESITEIEKFLYTMLE